ncbi:MAG: hypothetical protein MUC83_05460 [Pirellula sp.]|nr:hypothetical protein [Pirellula sp.]
MVTHSINASTLTAQEPRTAPQNFTPQPELTPPQSGLPVVPVAPPDMSPPSSLGPPTVTRSDLIVIPPVSPEGPLLLSDVIASRFNLL